MQQFLINDISNETFKISKMLSHQILTEVENKNVQKMKTDGPFTSKAFYKYLIH